MQYIQSLVLGGFVSLLALACSGGGSEGDERYDANYEIAADIASLEAPTEKAAQSVEESAQQNRMLIRNGRLEFETDDLARTADNIQTAIQTHKGYVGSEQSHNYGTRQSTTLNVRIPAASFETFIQDISKGVERFDTKDISARDVTEEFLDVEARLKNKKELELRYQEILKQAKNVKEILEIERELNTLRSDIESMEGRLKYLQNQVSLSSIQITYYKELTKKTAFGQKFAQGFRSGWTNLIWFLVGLVNIWPFLLLLGLGVFGLRRYLRNKKLKKQ
jgi:hypothetical protein